MKKVFAFAVAVALLASVGLAAEKGSWTGVVSDSKCAGRNHDAACVQKCMAGGAKAVLVVGSEAYTITNADKIKGHEMHRVTISGTLDAAKKEITADKVEMAH